VEPTTGAPHGRGWRPERAKRQNFFASLKFFLELVVMIMTFHFSTSTWQI
jgi:hypothetical protein